MKTPNKVLALTAGIGCVLFAVHNPKQPLIDILFLPSAGMMLLLISVMFYIIYNRKRLDFGKKAIWIPMLVIALSIGISGFINSGINRGFALTVFGLSLFGLYIMCRKEEETFIKPFMWIVILGTVGIIVYQIINTGVRTGGWISPTNYDIAIGVLILGTLMSAIRKQWWLSAIACVGILLTGAEEGIFILVVLVLFILARLDLSKKTLLPASVVVVTAIFIIVATISLYEPMAEKLTLAQEAVASENGLDHEKMNLATGYRWIDHWRISELKPFGHGYLLFEFYPGIPHNIALIIIEQVGVLACLCWFWITGYCLIKGSKKYLMIAFLGLGVFDHFIWTQITPWWWASIGLATGSNASDIIFRRE